MSKPSSRRQFLGALTLVGAGVGINALAMRGLRVPLMAEPRHVEHQARHPEDHFSVRADGAFFTGVEGPSLSWRAFTPEPVLRVQGAFQVTLDNVHPQAVLSRAGSGQIREASRDGLKRTVLGEAGPNTMLRLHWQVPFADSYRFAAIGDTGGGRELAWALQRTQQLGAQFLLLLGDLYYQPGDDLNVIRNLSRSPLPVYAAFGNHDIAWGFDQNLMHWFERGVGPRNSTFRLGGIQFVNLDTAADTIPWSGGMRGALLRQLPPLEDNPGIRDYVIFSHRPIVDLRPIEERPSDHSIENFGEGEWLREQLLQIGARTIINGHIHNSGERDDQGLHTYIAGEGLAHLDIVRSQGAVGWFDNPGERTARILIGEVSPGEPVRYHWDALNMPLDAHCSTRLRADMAKEKGHFDALLDHLDSICKNDS
ncbi:MAG: hypothetical protein CL389_00905 [Acidiferrobacteraceae bacterium]|jgi:hypothetical protein|nr:hypothetical protein [Acidiferrobacteraceae bacterium]MDP6397618.1 metallophosphoesterase [Arenicellales bacterium]MDP6550990.1 metallophosphoesterase [Arenicellales bacterium]MDP6792327.1 metallophosphoesterase [Arenicellales bacterium]MDP6919462.1 metallophosphoesterase [Arenicellales bacterium]|tara:strand:- start:6488 stop:7759 length:1272 start_codon:yes stop_codon:yes gene_type:complete